MKNNKSFLGLFLAILVLLPGCIHVPTYKRRSLQSVSDKCAYRGAEKNVIMKAKLLSREDKSALFGRHSRLIHDNDIQVMYLSIHNLSNVSYLFSPVDIDLSMMSSHDVAQLMKTSSVSRLAKGTALGAVGAGAIGWGVTGPMLCQSMAIAYVCLPLGAVAATASLVLFGTSIKSIIMNKRIRKDITEKTVHKKVIINSGEQYEGLIFIKSSDYTPQFAVTLHEQDNIKNSIVFDVDLFEQKQQGIYEKQ